MINQIENISLFKVKNNKSKICNLKIVMTKKIYLKVFIAKMINKVKNLNNLLKI